ncbi:MAG: MFS transporter [Myxococcales bacterium]|nr:MFS transporter [Myxococcales bacterium]
MGVLFLTVVLDLVGFGIVIPLQTFFALQFKATPLQITMLMTCYSLAQFVAAPIWGQLSDRFGRRPMLLASIAMTSVMLAGFASSTSLAMLFVFRTLHGIMTANIPIAQACVADLTTRENRAKGMGMIGAAFGIGFTLGPFIGGEFATDADGAPTLSTPIWIAAGLSVLNFALATLFLPETRPARSPAGDNSTAAGAPAGPHRSIALTAMVDALRHPVVGLCVLLTFVQVFAFSMMESCFTLFAHDVHGLEPKDVGRMFGMVGVVSIVVQGGLIGRLVKRYGERPLVPIGLSLVGVGTALLPSAPIGAPLFIAFGVMGLGQSLVNPSLSALISKSAGVDEQGRTLGAAQSMSALARAFGPAFGGFLYGAAGSGMPFYFSGLLLLSGVALAIPATARASRTAAG